MPDKFTATWVSHSSIRDFLNCPRAYYLNNVYRNSDTNHKIQITAPALSLGSAVHDVLESLSVIPTEQRFKTSLVQQFNKIWQKYSGKIGGFTDKAQEERYKQRGEEMLQKVMEHPGPLAELAVKIKQDLPHYYLSEADNIILCGKIDWLQYLPESDSVHIVDFKTSQKEERESLQLPIYHLLVHNTQKRKVAGASYWYLALSDELQKQELPTLEEAHEQILQIAKKIKLQRQLNVFKCPQGDAGCKYCRPLERILAGEGEFVGTSQYNQDLYLLPWTQNEDKESEIL